LTRKAKDFLGVLGEATSWILGGYTASLIWLEYTQHTMQWFMTIKKKEEVRSRRGLKTLSASSAGFSPRNSSFQATRVAEPFAALSS
jgi:hypothetical protein